MGDRGIAFQRSSSYDVTKLFNPTASELKRRFSFNVPRVDVLDDDIDHRSDGDESDHLLVSDNEIASSSSKTKHHAENITSARTQQQSSSLALQRIGSYLSRRSNSIEGSTSPRQQLFRDIVNPHIQSLHSFQTSSGKNSPSIEETIHHHEIRNSSTFDSSNGSESEILEISCGDNDFSPTKTTAPKSHVPQHVFQSEQPSASFCIDLELEPHERAARNQNHHGRPIERLISEFSWNEWLHQATYVSTFGVIGTILRIYIERFFGLDCEMKSSNPVNDSFQQISSSVCITTTGSTMQTGGALFIDLPANMFGW
jgi:hypothetical protein